MTEPTERPDATPSLPRLYTLEQVARLIDPTGTVFSARSIRSEIDKGRIKHCKIARRVMVPASAVREFLDAAISEASAKCRRQPLNPSYGSGGKAPPDPDGTSLGESTEEPVTGHLTHRALQTLE